MTPEDLAFLANLVQVRSGLVIRGDRRYAAESRLAPVARREGEASVKRLVERLKAGDDRLAVAVCEAMAITDTAFFRDPQVFDHLARHVLPALAAARTDRTVQVWCAGCSTGQEAYALAILAEEMQDRAPGLKLDIVATDLSERVLEKAQAGLYTQFEVQRGLPIRHLLKYFAKEGEMWRIAPRLRAAVRWRRLNLIEARRSLRSFDLILCRNVVSYFDSQTRARVMEQFDPALAPDGALVLGLGEAPPAGFEHGAGQHSVFSRRDRAQVAA